jgi:hypothetical protein
MIAISTYDLNMYPLNKIGLMVDMVYRRVGLADVQRRDEDIRIGRIHRIWKRLDAFAHNTLQICIVRRGDLVIRKTIRSIRREV